MNMFLCYKYLYFSSRASHNYSPLKIFSNVIFFVFLISISLFSDRLTVIEKTAEFISVMAGMNKVTVHAIPFRVDLFSGDQLVISVNARGLMRFEHMRPKPEQ